MSETPIPDTLRMETELRELHTRLLNWADLLDKQINPEASQHVRACAILVYDIITRLETQLNGIAECVKEVERKARLDEAKIWRQLKADLRPDSLFIEWAGERIADLEAKERL